MRERETKCDSKVQVKTTIKQGHGNYKRKQKVYITEIVTWK